MKTEEVDEYLESMTTEELGAKIEEIKKDCEEAEKEGGHWHECCMAALIHTGAFLNNRKAKDQSS